MSEECVNWLNHHEPLIQHRPRLRTTVGRQDLLNPQRCLLRFQPATKVLMATLTTRTDSFDLVWRRCVATYGYLVGSNYRLRGGLYGTDVSGSARRHRLYRIHRASAGPPIAAFGVGRPTGTQPWQGRPRLWRAGRRGCGRRDGHRQP